MDALGIVVMQLQGNGLVQFCEVGELAELAQLQLEVAKPTLHEAVLPRAGFGAGRELYLKTVAQRLVLVVKVL